ncbi:hypothetical protein Adt_45672 [Abeliophyllum distichum]|uniref:Uncharacterized protein n=1 Tax=Abeliophyllum distichum TaxID=126358 RepID=A0ABD1PEG8_9LAMI
MTDVKSHGGDGTCNPPHPPPTGCIRYESSRRRRSNRVTFEALTLKRFAGGKRPLFLMFENVEQTMQPIRNNAKYFMCLVRKQVRFTVPLCYPSWTEVLEEQWEQLRCTIEFAMYEAQLHRMERTITLLTANLQQRLPKVVQENDEEVDEDKNDGGGLGDP